LERDKRFAAVIRDRGVEAGVCKTLFRGQALARGDVMGKEPAEIGPGDF
jgi:hypothetical protein